MFGELKEEKRVKKRIEIIEEIVIIGEKVNNWGKNRKSKKEKNKKSSMDLGKMKVKKTGRIVKNIAMTKII